METGREFYEKMQAAKAAKAAATRSEDGAGNGSSTTQAPEPDTTPEVRVSVRPARRAHAPVVAPPPAAPPPEESPLDWDDGVGIEVERIGAGRGPGWRRRLGKAYYRGVEIELTRVGRLRPSPRLFDETEELAGGGTYRFTGRGRDGRVREIVKTLKGAPKPLTPESEEAAEEAAEEEGLYGGEPPQGQGRSDWWSTTTGGAMSEWAFSPTRGWYWPGPGPPVGAPPGGGPMLQPDEGLRRENEELRRKLDREEFQRQLDTRLGAADRPDPAAAYVDLMRTQAERTETERRERWDQWERERREAQERHQEEVRVEREKRERERDEERARYERDHERRLEEAKLERERQDRFFETLLKLQEAGGGKSSSVAGAIRDVVQGAVAMRDLTAGNAAEHPGAAAREITEAVGATIKDAAPALAGAFADVLRAWRGSQPDQAPQVQQIPAQVQNVTPNPSPSQPPPVLSGPRKPTPPDWLRLTQVLVLKGVRPKNAPASMVPYLAGVCEQAGIDTAAVIADLREETPDGIVAKLKLSEGAVPESVKPAVSDLVKALDTPEGKDWLDKFLAAVRESS